MNSESKNGNGWEMPDEAVETLRLVANLPAPAGLEDRVKARLKAVDEGGKVLAWPKSAGGWMQHAAMRSAAAAAIVAVVVGGGWTVYSRIVPAPQARVIAFPSKVNATGGFSAAGAIAVPKGPAAPVIPHVESQAPAAMNASSQSSAPDNAKTQAESKRRRKAAQVKVSPDAK